VPVVRELLIEGVADNLVIVDKDTHLEAVDSTIGTVRGLVVIPANGLITHLLVHKGTIFVDEFWLPTSVVERISPKGFFIKMNKEELENFIEYDEEQNNNWDKMPTDEPLETTPADIGPTIQSNGAAFRTAVLSDDVALATMISDNLFNDPRTADAVIEVIHERGMVTLQGTVASLAVKATAEEIANDFPGVVFVTNELAVDPRQ
jgi:hypothetical protein